MQNSCGSTLLPPNPPRGGEKRLFLGLGMSLFLRFFAQESISAHGTSEQPDMACAPPCCGATLASLVAGGISAALLRCCGCKRKWWWLRGQPVCAGLGLRVVSARAVSTLGCVSTAVCTHKRAHKQVPVPVPLGVPGNGVEGRLPRGGRGRCGSHPRQLHSCRPELEPDSEWRTSHLVPAAGQPVPISMSRHRPHQLPRRSAQP